MANRSRNKANVLGKYPRPSHTSNFRIIVEFLIRLSSSYKYSSCTSSSFKDQASIRPYVQSTPPPHHHPKPHTSCLMMRLPMSNPMMFLLQKQVLISAVRRKCHRSYSETREGSFESIESCEGSAVSPRFTVMLSVPCTCSLPVFPFCNDR